MKITASIHIAAPQLEVFEFTLDYKNRLSWDTFLKVARLEGADQPGKGVKAWCVSKQGIGMETEYVTYDPPKVTAVKMTRGPFYFKYFAGSWNFVAIGPTLTEVIFVYSYTLIFPLRVFTPLLTRILSKDVRQRLLDLKRCVEGLTNTA